MEALEIYKYILSGIYALFIFGVVWMVQDLDEGPLSIITCFSIALSCPCYWAVIRFAEDWDARRKIVVIPEKKKKKKPDIATGKKGSDKRTQAEILEDQRKKAKKMHNVVQKKDKKDIKKKVPKRKAAPKK